jgi:hypothetical protein
VVIATSVLQTAAIQHTRESGNRHGDFSNRPRRGGPISRLRGSMGQAERLIVFSMHDQQGFLQLERQCCQPDGISPTCSVALNCTSTYPAAREAAITLLTATMDSAILPFCRAMWLRPKRRA